MEYVWIGLIVLFASAEWITYQLVSIWFALGSLAGFIAAVSGADVTVQLIVAVAVTGISLAFSRPLAKKMVVKKRVPMNADRYISQTGYVIAEISNIDSTGQVKVLGQVWSARSQSEAVIPEGAEVRVLAIEGSKLIVELLGQYNKALQNDTVKKESQLKN